MLFKFLVLFSGLVLNNAVFALESAWSDRSCRFFSLQNGRVRWRQRHKMARFMCFQGYILVGNRYASCVNGEWDSPIPVCVQPARQMTTAAQVGQVHVLSRLHPRGEQIRLLCEWDSLNPVCGRPGCTMPRIVNSLVMERHHDAWLTIFCLPGYERHGPSVMYCDGRRWNGTAPTCEVQAQAAPLSCDFEDPDICGWKQDELHDFDWKRLNGKTPSSFLNTGPPYDHTYGKNGSGYYMYIESTSRIENDTARLISPVFSKSLSEDGCFSFYYHMYGRSIGGLRVYQKPDSLPIESMLKLSDEDKQQLQLFEMWGNQGNTWFRDVSMLKNQSDDFQIVIEGLRGRSYTSDIAIDDVAILEGQNCSIAKQQASTPPDFTSETCLNRCNLMGEFQSTGACDCTISCIDHQRCCADFFEVCIFNGDSATTDDDKASSGDLPQTEKLVASNATTETVKTTTSIPTTITTTTTTVKPTTVPVPKTTVKTTTAKVIKTTTIKKLTTTKKTTPEPAVTTLVPKATTKKITTIKTTKKPVPNTTPMITTTLRTLTTGKVQDIPKPSAASKISGNSGWRTTLIVIIILMCCVGAVWVAHEARGARGRQLVARLRGRSRQDPEVRYLHADTDDP